MRIVTLSYTGRYASLGLGAVLVAVMAACGDASTPNTPLAGESASASAEVTSPEPSAAETAMSHCADLAAFDDDVQAFQADALVGGIIGEAADPDELAAEADRLAQDATDLSAATPPAIADALATVVDSLRAVHEGLLAGTPANEAVNLMADEAPFAAYEVIRAELQTGECAGMW